jgi:hypothetical protein
MVSGKIYASGYLMMVSRTAVPPLGVTGFEEAMSTESITLRQDCSDELAVIVVTRVVSLGGGIYIRRRLGCLYLCDTVVAVHRAPESQELHLYHRHRSSL